MALKTVDRDCSIILCTGIRSVESVKLLHDPRADSKRCFESVIASFDVNMKHVVVSTSVVMNNCL